MSFEMVSERLTALQDSNAQLRQLIERLATINFQPGSVPLDNEEGNVMFELTADIQQVLKDQDEDFETLQEDVNDLNPGRPGSDLEQQKSGLDRAVKRAVRELQSCQTAFRKAQLTARRTLQAAQREERRLLLLSYVAEPSSSEPAVPIHNRRKDRSTEQSSQDKEVNASSDVTAALRRTHDMMVGELSKSQFAHDTLKESTAALERLGEQYSTLDTLLSSSKNLLGTLLRSQKSDTWYLETAFYLLLGTIIWLIWRRLLYGPTWWLVWFPMKIFLRSLKGVLTGIGIIGGTTSSVSAVSSFMASQSTVVHNSAAKTLSAPPGATGPPVINVGGGGRGAPMRGPNSPPERPESERVSEIIDGSQESHKLSEEHEGEPTSEEEEEDVVSGKEPRNPMKRMWEEEKEAPKEAQRRKDEL